MQVLVSAIIPVYNNVKTLRRCVDSVLAQTYPNLEVILVDNGSGDSSDEVCDEFAEKDPRVRVLHEKKEGVSATRNQGVRIAKGDYITFIDSDDHITPDYIEKLVAAIADDDCILAMCNSYEVKGDVVTERVFSKSGKISVRSYMHDFFYCRAEGGTCWGKLYRAEYIAKLFREYNYCEDAFFNFDYLMGCDGYVTVIPDRLYYYVRRKNSITGLKKPSDLMDVLGVCEGIRNICNEKFPKLIHASDAFLLNNAFFVYLNSSVDTGSEGDELRQKALSFIRKYRGRVLFDPKATFKTKLACLISYVSMKLLSFIYGRIQ
ncbi:MAG: glycosyltransferase family 2 protein [Lachnospiraceae bacterium]|nr:glycosyltransferase family 2 protein [Lachnospiraceae bacterium]